MLELLYSNGAVFVYNVAVWSKLRKQHRIIGEIIGNTNFVPCLPLQLQPEEVLLLLDNNLACVIERTYGQEDLTARHKTYETFEDDLLHHEKLEYRKIRKAQLEQMLDKIVTKRRKTGDNRTPDEILEEELDKSTMVTKSNMIWPISLEPPSNPAGITRIVAAEEILTTTTELKRMVYKDFWQRGYYITQGHKFGGDFLVYLGDPVIYHAIFIVRCVDAEKKLSSSEIVAFGRLGTSVKKRAVLASCKDSQVSYITINWIDA